MAENLIINTTQYLIFKIDDESFAVDVEKVREVLDFVPITKVPKSQKFMKGIINVRGSVVPVIDLRLKFGMPEIENTVNTRIILMDLSDNGESIILGALADSVHEVTDLNAQQIEDMPKIGNNSQGAEFITGIGKKGEEFIMILDVFRIFSTDELAIIDMPNTDLSAESANNSISLENAPA